MELQVTSVPRAQSISKLSRGVVLLRWSVLFGIGDLMTMECGLEMVLGWGIHAWLLST